LWFNIQSTPPLYLLASNKAALPSPVYYLKYWIKQELIFVWETLGDNRLDSYINE